jgi:hypothetical protein
MSAASQQYHIVITLVFTYTVPRTVPLMQNRVRVQEGVVFVISVNFPLM